MSRKPVHNIPIKLIARILAISPTKVRLAAEKVEQALQDR